MKRFLNNIEEILSAAVLMFMLSLAFINVVFRYISTSISFTEEITTSMFVLLCLLGTAVAAKRQSHLGLSILTERISLKNQAIAATCANFLGAIFSIFLIYTGFFMTVRQYDLGQISIALQWPEWVYGSFIPIGAAFMTLRFLQASHANFKIAYKVVKVGE